MIRVILAPNDLLTSFDLRAQKFRVNVEFSLNIVDKNFFEKMSLDHVTFRVPYFKNRILR